MSAPLNKETFVAAKLAWQRGLLVDSTLTPFAKVLGSFLMHDLHSLKGGAWRSQSSLAELLSVNLRTIRRASRELEKAGHLRIAISKGRGHANFYEAITRRSDTEGLTSEVRSGASAFSADGRTQKSQPSSANRTTVSAGGPELRTTRAGWADICTLPSLSDSITSPFASPGTPLETFAAPPNDHRANPLNRSRSTNRTDTPASSGRRRVPPCPAVAFGNSRVRARIAAHIGETATVSYLDPAAWRESDSTIVCRLGIAANALRSRAGEVIRELGIAVVLDTAAHEALTSNIIAFSEVA